MSAVVELERQGTPSKEDSGRRTTVLVVGGITLVALALRLAAFRGSFFGDELFTHEIATRASLGAVLDGVRSKLEITPPLFFFVAWMFQKLGDPLVWLRVPSLLAGIATVPLVYVLGARTLGRRAAILGATLFALSPIATFYATEARAYALMMFLVVLSTIALLRAIDTNDLRWWVAVALVDAAAMYTHYTCIFVLVTQAGWALFTNRDLVRPLLVAHVSAVLLYVPWIPSLLDDRAAPTEKLIEQLHPFGLSNGWLDFRRFAIAGPSGSLSRFPGTFAIVLAGGAAVIAVGGFVWRRIRRSGPVPPRAVLIGLLALATPVGAAVVSIAGDDVFLARNLLASLPALTLAAAALLVALPRHLAAVALALTLTAFGIGAAGWRDRDVQRPAYAEASEFVRARAHPGDQILELQYLTGVPGRALRVQLPSAMPWFPLRFPNKEADAVDAAERTGARIFFVRPDNPALANVRPDLVQERFEPVEQRSWGGAFPLTVIVYEAKT